MTFLSVISGSTSRWPSPACGWGRSNSGNLRPAGRRPGAVIRPRLLVVLNVSGDELLRRVRHRGRTAEQGLTAVQLERIATEIRRQAAGPEVGPVLHAPDGDPQAAEMEVLAALAAMR